MNKRLLLVLAVISAAACSSGGDDGGPSGPTPAISITLSASSMSVQQGSNGSVNVTLTRTGNFTGTVNVAVTGAPSGVTATANPTSIAAGSSSATITLAVGATVAAGTSSLTVRASGSGVSDATATLSLVVTAAPTGGFTLSLNPASVTVVQGATTQATVNLTRTAPFAGAVALTASGLPSGVTAAFNPASATGANSTLTLTAASNAATGTTTITVRGTGTGVAEQSATLSLVVSPMSTGGTGTWRICGYETAPLWFSVQNGDGAWTRVSANQDGSYPINVTASRGGVAYVLPNGTTGYDLAIFYGSGEELRATAESRCTAGIGTKTVNGTVAGVGALETASIALGGAFASVLPGGGSGFTLQRVADGSVDLIAARIEQSFSGTTFTSIVHKLIIRRNLNPANNSTLPVLDFAGGEAFDPVTRTVTVNNLGTDQSIVSAWYQTANGFVNTFFSGGPAASASRTWYGVPAAQQQASDLHALQVGAFTASGTTTTAIRNALLYFHDATDRTVTLGPALSTPTMSTAATSPYVRFRAQLPVQAEYDRGWGFSWTQGTTGNVRTAVITISRGWQGSATTVDVAIPDFTAVADWNSNWGPRTGAATQWAASATKYTPDATPLTDGGLILGAARTGSITP